MFICTSKEEHGNDNGGIRRRTTVTTRIDGGGVGPQQQSRVFTIITDRTKKLRRTGRTYTYKGIVGDCMKERSTFTAAARTKERGQAKCGKKTYTTNPRIIT